MSYEYTAVSALAGLLMFAVLVGGVQWVVRHALQGSPDVEPNFEGPELSLREAANRQRAETNDRAE